MNRSVAPSRATTAPVSSSNALSSARTDGRADGDDPPAALARLVDRLGGPLGHAEVLGVDVVLQRVVLGDRPERVEPDVELDPRQADARASRRRSSSASVKCSPAVGAAALRSSAAKTVW